MALDLRQVGGGFSAPVFASQAVFRRALSALSRPGRIEQIRSDASLPSGAHPAAMALALSLLDADTRLWLSPGLAGASDYLRFHTGCTATGIHAEANFALIAAPAELPKLESFCQGSEQHPDRSAALIVQVPALSGEQGWRLTGPGIRNEAHLTVQGLSDGFVTQWRANARRFPCGVDIFFTSGARLAGLPRTTRIEV